MITEENSLYLIHKDVCPMLCLYVAGSEQFGFFSFEMTTDTVVPLKQFNLMKIVIINVNVGFKGVHQQKIICCTKQT